MRMNPLIKDGEEDRVSGKDLFDVTIGLSDLSGARDKVEGAMVVGGWRW